MINADYCADLRYDNKIYVFLFITIFSFLDFYILKSNFNKETAKDFFMKLVLF